MDGDFADHHMLCEEEIAVLQARIAELEAEVAEDYDEGLPCACRWERAPHGVPCSTTGVRLQVCAMHQELESRVTVLVEGIRLYRINFRHEDIPDEAWADASTDVLAWEREHGEGVK